MAVGLLLAIVGVLGVGAADANSADDPPVPPPGGDTWSNEETRLPIDEIDHARIESWTRSGESGDIAAADDGGTVAWRFDALGRTYDVVLQPNTVLLDAMTPADREALLADQSVMRGTVLGVDDSWVRVTETAEGVSGMIFDGERMLQIEPVSRFPELADGSGAPSVVFVSGELETEPLICGVTGEVLEGDHPLTGDHLRDLFDEADIPVGPDAENGRLLVSLVEDQDWAGNSVAIFNSVDGIYESNVGVNIQIAQRERLTINYTGDPLGDFRAVADGRGQIGVAHLLTGRNQFGGSVIGQAYLNSVCSNFALGVSANHSQMVTLVAHEIGHNVGSRHDPDIGCSSGFIMWPSLNGSQSFSDCSRRVITDFLASRPNCLFGDDPPPTTTTAPPTTLPPTTPPPSPGAIEATMSYADGAPAPGAVIDLFEDVGGGARGEWLGDARTDANGRVRFSADGCRVVTFIAPDGQRFLNQTSWENAQGCPDPGQTISLSATLAGSGTGPASIGGSVDRGGAPVGGVVVDLFVAQGDGSRGSWLGDVATDGSGDFTFDVGPGCYVLTFIAPSGQTFTNGSQWYQLQVCVDAGESRTGIDATLR